MKHRQRALVSVVGVLLVAAVIAFVITGTEPLHGKDKIPDLRGVWQLDSSFYLFENILDPDDLPILEGDQAQLTITDQTGGAFGGFGSRFEVKLAGAIRPDGTVSIQFYEPDELRGFLTGSIDSNGRTISGHLHAFADFWNDAGDQSTVMGSGVFELTRVN